MKMSKAVQQGYTLLELMIVVAIIGIIGSIAVPSYTDYIEKGRATEATATLANLRIQMEQCYQDVRDYTQCAAFCTPASGDVFFSYSCTPAATADTYTLSAAGVGNMSSFSFSVDEGNNKNSVFSGTTGAGCWLSSKTGAC
jgi:prepilin-type N-terminal cleavage/methylation domain-containing protein